MNDPTNQTLYKKWLLLICFMIIVMIALGGITRLTQSGLSMSSWKFYGNLPPINEQEWEAEFNRYKATPEFRLINSSFSTDDFKSIYWWEYIHRMTGRSIAVIYVLPLLYFAFTRKIKRKDILNHIAGFALIASQGVLGWVMVKSGLKNKPHVDHYLLAAHFSLALFTLIFHVKLLLQYNPRSTTIKNNAGIIRSARFALGLASLQLVLGALVAGTKGGLLYNTFPKMGIHWIPPEILNNDFFAVMQSGAALQFIHRIGALLLLIAVSVLISHIFRSSPDKRTRKAGVILATIITIQIATGISCVLFGVPVLIGVVHQIGGVLLLLTIFYVVKTSTSLSNAADRVKQHAESGTPASKNHDQPNLERPEVGLIK
jgi:heme a synthase